MTCDDAAATGSKEMRRLQAAAISQARPLAAPGERRRALAPVRRCNRRKRAKPPTAPRCSSEHWNERACRPCVSQYRAKWPCAGAARPAIQRHLRHHRALRAHPTTCNAGTRARLPDAGLAAGSLVPYLRREKPIPAHHLSALSRKRFVTRGQAQPLVRELRLLVRSEPRPSAAGSNGRGQDATPRLQSLGARAPSGKLQKSCW